MQGSCHCMMVIFKHSIASSSSNAQTASQNRNYCSTLSLHVDKVGAVRELSRFLFYFCKEVAQAFITKHARVINIMTRVLHNKQN